MTTLHRFVYAVGVSLLSLPALALAGDAVIDDKRRSAVQVSAPKLDLSLRQGQKKRAGKGGKNKKNRQADKKRHIIDNWVTYNSKKKAGVSLIDIEVEGKMEFFNLRNKKLRRGRERENKQEMQPSLRLSAYFLKNNPVYGRVKLKLKQKIKQETAKGHDSETRLDLSQAYIGLNKVIPDTHIRLGRWSYSDEREWLFDEKLDGVLLQWERGKWEIDALGGRVNYWQKDLLNRASRNSSAIDIGGLLVRRNIDKYWYLGAYGIIQNDSGGSDARITHYGIRSHSNPKKGLRHWMELGMVTGHNKERDIEGYVVDVGATYLFKPSGILRPRLTLGYAFGSRRYQQTTLNSNEANFGGLAKFKIYGETLNPDLDNMHILTAGFGVDIASSASVDLVYHRYKQANLGNFSDMEADLSTKYDDRHTRHLGSALDLILGWKPRDNILVEGRLGAFLPSSRLHTTKKNTSPRPDPAYSVGLEVGFAFD